MYRKDYAPSFYPLPPFDEPMTPKQLIKTYRKFHEFLEEEAKNKKEKEKKDDKPSKKTWGTLEVFGLLTFVSPFLMLTYSYLFITGLRSILGVVQTLPH